MNDRSVRIEEDDELLIWVLDQPGEKHNSFSMQALDDIDWAFSETRSRGAKAVVIVSAKPNSFVVGADIRMLRTVESAGDASAVSRRAHDLLGRIREATIPYVAAIHGPALGGGLELALACTYRLATDHPDTKFGLPEVMLGLLPAGGGTQLLPRLVGVQSALELMLTGKNTYPRPARSMGLVDALIHRPGLLQAGKAAARKLLRGNTSESKKSLQSRILDSTPLTRKIIYKKAAETAAKKSRGNYPAPAKIIECVRVGMEDGLEQGLRLEELYFGELAVTPQSRELVRLFFAKREAEKNPFEEKSRSIRRIGVLGAGLMGSGITQVSVENGLDVLVKDRNLELASNARKQVYEETSRRVKKRALGAFERDVLIERVTPVDSYDLFTGVELVIEAAPENIEVKHALIREVEDAAAESCIFASNTSSIPIARLQEASRRPEQVIGMHYFSPVPKIPLLEIIRTDGTPEWVLATAIDVGLRQGKTVIVVNDGPGFYTTRILALYMNEALDVLRDGGSIPDVDTAVKNFGFPIGPFELFDLVGIDVASKITEVLSDYFVGRGIVVNAGSASMAADGLLGKKSGRGFYEYDRSGDQARKKDLNDEAYAYFSEERHPFSSADIQQRLALVMINEATYCLEEGVLQSAKDGDVGAVFGLGFPPFRGGPFRYVEAVGASEIVRRLESLRELHGPQFTPSGSLAAKGAEKGSFYN
jgi:3-hydroxyacyl-CoA dehydrogenase/enoyl-CoA hydratase/3-hydroxybutyryl-CoA epimerase